MPSTMHRFEPPPIFALGVDRSSTARLARVGFHARVDLFSRRVSRQTTTQSVGVASAPALRPRGARRARRTTTSAPNDRANRKRRGLKNNASRLTPLAASSGERERVVGPDGALGQEAAERVGVLGEEAAARLLDDLEAVLLVLAVVGLLGHLRGLDALVDLLALQILRVDLLDVARLRGRAPVRDDLLVLLVLEELALHDFDQTLLLGLVLRALLGFEREGRLVLPLHLALRGRDLGRALLVLLPALGLHLFLPEQFSKPRELVLGRARVLRLLHDLVERRLVARLLLLL
mmetsp:Transcript_22134/g.68226  ORF Transcript_22134/g.68226 Transcript_22134/m.68226 type:complete len:291 (-) Transcript_22134:600-1472(-)